MTLQKKQIGKWEFLVSEHEERFPKWAANDALRIINDWKKVFPQENTAVFNKFGVPSLIIRLDCMLNRNERKLEICEIEERPAAIGISTIVNPEFKMLLGLLKNKWPEIKVIVSPKRETTDDNLWSEISNSNGDEKLVLVRADPDEEEFHHLQNKSISTIKNKGNKSYGVPIGLWKEISVADLNDLPWNKNFVLKPLIGSKCKDVTIFLVKRDRKIRGGSTRSHVEDAIRKNGIMYLQQYIAPMKCPAPGLEENNMLYRFFFGYNPEAREYIPLNGVWNARKNYKLQGAPDTIWGALNLEQ